MLARLRWLLAGLALVWGATCAGLTAYHLSHAGRVGAPLDLPSGIVRTIVPGLAAERAGILAGDRVLLGRMPAADAASMLHEQDPVANRAFSVPIERNGRILSLTLLPGPETRTWSLLNDVLSITIAIPLSIIAAWVIAVGRGGAALGVYLLALGPAWGPVAGISDALIGPVLGASLTLIVASFAGMVIVAIRAAQDPISRRARVFEGAIVASAVAVAALAIVQTLTFERFISLSARDFVTGYAAATLAVAALLLGRKTVQLPDQRRRLGWFWAGASGIGIGQMLYFTPLVNPKTVTWLPVLLDTSILAGVIALGYAVAKHHVVDLRFVLNRAAVYGALSTAVVAVLTLVDWLAGSILSASRLALPIDIVAALVLGFSMQHVQRRVEEFVDRVLFRARRRAQMRLDRVAAGLETTEDERIVAPALVDEPAEALALGSAALFVRVGDGAYTPDRTLGWDDGVPSIHARDPFLLHVAGAPGAFRLDASPPLPFAPDSGDAIPRVAVPIRFRGILAAFAVYGLHAGGADLDVDEIAILERLAKSASYALDRADAARMREINAELRAALAAAMAAG